MLVWRGYGLLTPVLLVVIVLAVMMGAGAALDALGRPRLDDAALALGLVLAAIANWLLGTRLNDAPGRALVDPATGETVILRRTHSLFFIRMEWWSVAMVLFAALMIYSAFVDPHGPAAAQDALKPTKI